MRILCLLAALCLAAGASAAELREYLEQSSATGVMSRLAGGADPNEVFEDGRTPLTIAVRNGDLPVARALLSYGADPDLQETVGLRATPLMLSTSAPHLDIAQLLLENGATVNRVDVNGDPAINWAAYYGHADMVGLLLSGGANPSIETRHGAVLNIALRRGHMDVVDLLIQRRAVGERVEGTGALILGKVLAGDAVSVQRTLDYAPPDTLDAAGTPILALAAWRGDTPMVSVLLAGGASVDLTDANGYTALHHAAREGHTAIVTRLLDANADPNAQGAEIGMSLTPLMLAASEGRTEVMQELAFRGADLDLTNSDSQHAALFAAVNGEGLAASWLVDMGCDKNVRDRDGNTLLSVAREYGYEDFAARLEAAGAAE